MSDEFPKIGCIQHDCAACKQQAKTNAAKDALLKTLADALEQLVGHLPEDGPHEISWCSLGGRPVKHADVIVARAALAKYRKVAK